MTRLNAPVAAAPIAAPVAGETGSRSAAAGAEAARQAVAAAPLRPPAAAEAEVRRATAEANEALRRRASELSFEFDDEIGRVVVKLVDTSTREVLRQIPTEEMLEIARSLKQQTQAGALLRTDA
jgi:flagellar protein FlaG